MKKISIILMFCFASVVGWGQYVNFPTTGSATTGSTTKGGIFADSSNSVLSKHTFADTTAANFSVISKYKGTMIYTTGDDSYWIRRLLPNRWDKFNTSAASIVSISQGVGIVATPNPITTVGTIAVDTTVMATIYYVGTAISPGGGLAGAYYWKDSSGNFVPNPTYGYGGRNIRTTGTVIGSVLSGTLNNQLTFGFGFTGGNYNNSQPITEKVDTSHNNLGIATWSDVTRKIDSVGRTGVLSITGTVNQISVSPTGTGNVILSTPQDISTMSNVNFANIHSSGGISQSASVSGYAGRFENTFVNGGGVTIQGASGTDTTFLLSDYLGTRNLYLLGNGILSVRGAVSVGSITTTGNAIVTGKLGVSNTNPSKFTAYSLASFGDINIANVGITIASTPTGSGFIEFAKGIIGAQAYNGYIQYNHSTDVMSLAVAAADRMTIAGTGVVTITGLGTGAVQATAGVLSVISDSKAKNLFGRLNVSATSLLMKIPIPQGWSYNYKSNLPERAWGVKQFGLLADSVHEVLGEEFAPTQPQSKSDSAAGIKNYGLSDRALLSLTIQALQEANKKIDDLEERVAKLEKSTVSYSKEDFGSDKIPVIADAKKKDKAQYRVFDLKTGVTKIIKK